MQRYKYRTEEQLERYQQERDYSTILSNKENKHLLEEVSARLIEDTDKIKDDVTATILYFMLLFRIQYQPLPKNGVKKVKKIIQENACIPYDMNILYEDGMTKDTKELQQDRIQIFWQMNMDAFSDLCKPYGKEKEILYFSLAVIHYK